MENREINDNIEDLVADRFSRLVLSQGGSCEIAIAAPGTSAFNRNIYVKDFSFVSMYGIKKFFNDKSIAYLSGIHEPVTLTDFSNKRVPTASRTGVKHRNVHKIFFPLDADLKDCFGEDLRSKLSINERMDKFICFLNEHPALKEYVSFMIFTGNGVHLYFEFNIIFKGSEQEWKDTYHNILYFVENDLCKNTIKFDRATKNIARLMRLPFSTNFKNKDFPIPTKAIFYNHVPKKFDLNEFRGALRSISSEKDEHEPSAKPAREKHIPLLATKKHETFIHLIHSLEKGIGHRNNSAFLLVNNVVAQEMHDIEIYLSLFYDLLDQPDNDLFAYGELEAIFTRVTEKLELESEDSPKSSMVVPQMIKNDSGKRVLKKSTISWDIVADLFIQSVSNGGKSRLICFNGTFRLFEDGIYVEKDEVAIKQLASKFIYRFHKILFIATTAITINELCVHTKIKLNFKTEVMPPFVLKKSQCLELNIIAFQNGFISLENITELRKAKLNPFSKDLVLLHRLPFNYDPNKRSYEWEKFLNTSLPEVELQLVFQEFAGLILTRIMNFEKFLIIIGDGSNGKGVAISTLSIMVGENNISTISLDTLDPKNTFNLKELYGKTLNIDSDLNQFSSASEGTLKKLISGELITANQKFKDYLSFHPCAKWIIASNFTPKFRDSSDGVSRRAIIIPFNHQIPPELRNRKLRDREFWMKNNEIAGVCNWVLEGLHRLLKNDKFSESAIIENELNKFKNTQSSVREFALDTFEEVENQTVSTFEAYQLYRAYCQDNSLLQLPKHIFTRELKYVFKKMKQLENAREIYFEGSKKRDREFIGIKVKVPHTQHRALSIVECSKEGGIMF